MPHPQTVDWFSEPPPVLNAVVRRGPLSLRVEGAALDRASGAVDPRARLSGLSAVVCAPDGVFAVRRGERVARLLPGRFDLSRL